MKIILSLFNFNFTCRRLWDYLIYRFAGVVYVVKKMIKIESKTYDL